MKLVRCWSDIERVFEELGVTFQEVAVDLELLGGKGWYRRSGCKRLSIERFKQNSMLMMNHRFMSNFVVTSNSLQTAGASLGSLVPGV